MIKICVNAIPFWLAVRWGLFSPSWTKNRIMSAMNRISPAALPSFAISSARSFSFDCSGVFSVSPRSAAYTNTNVSKHPENTK